MLQVTKLQSEVDTVRGSAKQQFSKLKENATHLVHLAQHAGQDAQAAARAAQEQSQVSDWRAPGFVSRRPVQKEKIDDQPSSTPYPNLNSNSKSATYNYFDPFLTSAAAALLLQACAETAAQLEAQLKQRTAQHEECAAAKAKLETQVKDVREALKALHLTHTETKQELAAAQKQGQEYRVGLLVTGDWELLQTTASLQCLIPGLTAISVRIALGRSPHLCMNSHMLHSNTDCCFHAPVTCMQCEKC